MNNCPWIKDLLPLYVEGLTSEDTNAVIEEHLQVCSSCNEHYKQIKDDYAQDINVQHVQAQPKQIEQLIQKLGRYQRSLKLIGALIALLLASIIAGAEVAFLSTLPVLIIIPFFCYLYVNRSLILIGAMLPFGIIGGILSENNGSFIPFFTIVALLLSTIGVGAAIVIKQGFKQTRLWTKAAWIIPSIAALIFSSVLYFSFWGNPVSYVNTLVQTKQYVAETYEPGTLTFTGLKYNFKDHKHFAQYEYVLNGSRQVATITLYNNGHVSDYYKQRLEMQFYDEQGQTLHTALHGAVKYAPLHISAYSEEELHITHDELNYRYFLLSYDLPRREQATINRNNERQKLQYLVSFGTFQDEYTTMSQEEFVDKASAVVKTLQEQNFQYKQIELRASLDEDTVHVIKITPATAASELSSLYGTMDRYTRK